MIRFGLLQFRSQALAALAALLTVAVVLVITGAQVNHLYAASGLASCRPGGGCPALASALLARLHADGAFGVVYWAGIFALYFVPAIIGMFWGAPLIARELEAGTFRVAWTQSVTRTRWLAVKLGLAGLASMAAAGLLSLMVSWWARQVDPLDPFGMNRLQPAMFSARGIAPIGYAAFALALGVTAGMLIRSTVAAIAATPVVLGLVEGAMIGWIRPRLIAPVRATMPLNLATVQAAGSRAGAPADNNLLVNAPVTEPGGWVYSSQVLSAAGRTSLGPEPHACVSGSTQACNAALGQLHLLQTVTYQPASRFWPLQWAETAVLAGLALLLAGFCFFWIRRRLTDRGPLWSWGAVRLAGLARRDRRHAAHHRAGDR